MRTWGRDRDELATWLEGDPARTCVGPGTGTPAPLTSLATRVPCPVRTWGRGTVQDWLGMSLTLSGTHVGPGAAREPKAGSGLPGRWVARR